MKKVLTILLAVTLFFFVGGLFWIAKNSFQGAKKEISPSSGKICFKNEDCRVFGKSGG